MPPPPCARRRTSLYCPRDGFVLARQLGPDLLPTRGSGCCVRPSACRPPRRPPADLRPVGRRFLRPLAKAEHHPTEAHLPPPAPIHRAPYPPSRQGIATRPR